MHGAQATQTCVWVFLEEKHVIEAQPGECLQCDGHRITVAVIFSLYVVVRIGFPLKELCIRS